MKHVNNEITALFMGQLDRKTGKWFPIKKMNWKKKRNNNYLDCSIRFIQGAEDYQAYFPQKKLFFIKDITKIMKYPDVVDSIWSNRMPVARPLEEELKFCMGLDLNSPADPIEFVARDGGYRRGDKCDIFPEVTPDSLGNYNFIFRGIDAWVMSSQNRPELDAIEIGAKVKLQFPEKDEVAPEENKPPAIDPPNTPPEITRMKMYVDGQMVGYAPHYIKELYRRFGEQLGVQTFHKNLGFPFEYQFLFLATVNQNTGIPFSEAKYQPLNV